MTITELDTLYIDLVEAAHMLKIHPQSLARLVRAGKGPPARLFAGKYIMQRTDVEQFGIGYYSRPGRRPMRRLL